MGAEESLDSIFYDTSSLDLSSKNLQILSLDPSSSGKILVVNAKDNKIRRIPPNKTITHLNLSSNSIGDKINDIAKQLNELPKLSHLDLSENEISKIPELLAKNNKILELSLADNRVESLNIANSKLIILNLAQNRFTSLPKLPKTMTNLNMNGNNINTLTGGVENIIKLGLSLNGLESISPKINFSSLKSLDISRNNLTALPDFQSCAPNLVTLDFGHNKVKELPNLPKNIKNLNAKNNQLTHLYDLSQFVNLKNIDISFNEIEELPKLPKSLFSFHAIFNQIYEFIESETPILTRVNLAHNQLEEIPYFTSNVITEFNLSNNRITTLSISHIYEKIENLDVSNNMISSIPEDFFKLNDLKIFRIQKNKLRSLPSDIGSSKIEELNISMNHLCSLPESLPSTLGILRCAFCKLHEFPNSISKLTSLMEIDISNNQFSSLPIIPNLLTCLASYNCFKVLPSFSETIEVVDFSCNNLQILENQNYPHLYDADFSHNDIRVISNPYNWPEIKYLKLSFNPINSEASFDVYTKLHTLAIEGTNIKLKSLPPTYHQILVNDKSMFKGYTTNFIDIQGNIGYAYMKGLRAKMEDTMVIRNNGKTYIYGVFDGHGGDFASCFTSYQFSRTIDYIDAFNKKNTQRMFSVVNQSLQKTKSLDGTTAVVVFHQGDEMIVGNVGDSRALLLQGDGTLRFQTEDHSVCLRREFARIRKAGGIFQGGRVAGHVGLTRSIGNYGVTGISAAPDISKIRIQPDDKWLIIGCDGLFGYVTVEQIQRMAQKAKEPIEFAYELRNTAYSQNGTDNVSVLVVKLNES